MNLLELMKTIDRIDLAKYGTCIKKNLDYSTSKRAHANFEEQAALCKLLNVDVKSPLGCIEFMILWKLRRRFKLKRAGGTPENESLFDNTVDEEVYNDLYLTYEEVEP